MATAWETLTRRAQLRLPPRVRGWVALESSMTEKIGAVAGGPVCVEVLRQARGRLLPDERPFMKCVGAPTIREVCLLVEGQPLLLARTVYVSRRLTGHPVLMGLGEQPLGSLLFAEGRPSLFTTREFTVLSPEAPLFHLVRQRHEGVAEGYWARRTLFLLFGEPILTTEIFLPGLIHRKSAG